MTINQSHIINQRIQKTANERLKNQFLQTADSDFLSESKEFLILETHIIHNIREALLASEQQERDAIKVIIEECARIEESKPSSIDTTDAGNDTSSVFSAIMDLTSTNPLLETIVNEAENLMSFFQLPTNFEQRKRSIHFALKLTEVIIEHTMKDKKTTTKRIWTAIIATFIVVAMSTVAFACYQFNMIELIQNFLK